MIGLFSFLLQSFTGHLQVVVPLSFGQFGKIHQTWVLPLVIITDLGEGGRQSYFNVSTWVIINLPAQSPKGNVIELLKKVAGGFVFHLDSSQASVTDFAEAGKPQTTERGLLSDTRCSPLIVLCWGASLSESTAVISQSLLSVLGSLPFHSLDARKQM